MKRLGIIHPFVYRYARGIERFVLSIAPAFARMGVDTELVTWRWPNPLTWSECDKLSNFKIRIISPGRYYSGVFASLWYLMFFLQKSYDMVIIHFADYGEDMALNLAKLLGVDQKFMIVLHFPFSQAPHRYKTLKKTGIAKRAQQIVSVSHFVAREAEVYFQRKSQVISHGVDAKQFKSDKSIRAKTRAELGVSENDFLILTVAALEERKGVQWVINALPFIMKEIPNILYLVLGEGPYKDELDALVKVSSLSRNVKFLSGTANASYFNAADLFAILAKGEASSLVTLEALACELPVLASRKPPFDELIKDEWGRQVDETDTSEVSATIIALLKNYPLRQKMGFSGRNYVIQKHDWNHVAGQYMELMGWKNPIK